MTDMADTKEIVLGGTGGWGHKLPPAGTDFPTRELPSAAEGMVWRQILGKWCLVSAAVIRGLYVTKG